MAQIQRADIQQLLGKALGTRGTVVETLDSTIVPVFIVGDLRQYSSTARRVSFSWSQPAAGAGQFSLCRLRNPADSGQRLTITMARGVTAPSSAAGVIAYRAVGLSDLLTLDQIQNYDDGEPLTNGTPMSKSRGSTAAAPNVFASLKVHDASSVPVNDWAWPLEGVEVLPGWMIEFSATIANTQLDLVLSGILEPVLT